MNLPASSSQDANSNLYMLIIQNDLDELTRLSEWVNHLAGQLNLSSKVTFRLDLTLAEAVTNVIQYAYEDEKNHEIVITLQYRKNGADVEVIDEGQPFDPLQAPEVVFPRSLDEASEGGLGIHLIRTYTDECYYRREVGKNILTMVVRESNDG